MQRITTIGNAIMSKDSVNFVNRFIPQRRGIHNDLVCENMISKQFH